MTTPPTNTALALPTSSIFLPALQQTLYLTWKPHHSHHWQPVALHFLPPPPCHHHHHHSPDPHKLHTELQEYTQGLRTTFSYTHPQHLDSLLQHAGVHSPFQRQVLTYVNTVPYGHTTSYKNVATAINNPSASRAVGRALATNPLPIIIPCHRVVPSSNRSSPPRQHMGGYRGGTPIKQKLLLLESPHPPLHPTPPTPANIS